MGRNTVEGFSSRMRELREAKGLSRDQLAVAAGTSSHSIAKLEQGIRSPSLELAWRVAKSLGCSLDDLVQESSLLSAPAAKQPKKPRGRPRKEK